jgi:hypothetical protein
MNTFTNTFLAVAMTASFAGTAMADDDKSCTLVPRAEWMSMDAIKAKAVSMGYDVRSIKREGTCYEAKALVDGSRREIMFNPATGAVVYEENDS